MKAIHLLIIALFIVIINQGCRGSRLRPATPIIPEEVIPEIVKNDSLNNAQIYMDELKKNRIEFQTFSGKAKIQYEDENGRQPDGIANIRMQKDSVIWVSITSAFLGIEAVRVLITPNEIIVLKKLEKIIERHPFEYIQKELQIPVSFADLQNIVLGNPIMVKDSIIGYSEQDNFTFINTGTGKIFNLLTIDKVIKKLLQSKITDERVIPANTALFELGDYQTLDGVNFAHYRRIKVESKVTQAEIRMAYQQIEFNKELSFPFSIPSNYKTN